MLPRPPIPPRFPPQAPTRRGFLASFGHVALASLLSRPGELLAATPASAPSPNEAVGAHFPPRVKRVIQLFMNGGASQMDTFDYKPELERRHGMKFDPGDGSRVEAATSEPGLVMKSPFAFRRHGQCGRWVSSVFPHLAGCVDRIAFLLAIQSRTNVHGPASFLMNTGFLLPGFPCLGAWVSHALGHLADNLPTFVVLPDPRGLPYNQRGNFSAGFLPATHAGTLLHAAAPEPIPYLHPPAGPASRPDPEPAGLALLHQLNERHRAEHPEDTRLDARIRSYELAARMQLAAPEAFDLRRESPATRQLYGLEDPVTEDFGRRCLLARRLVERGVRFVQVWSGAGGPKNNWDNHTDIITELPKVASATDRPIAALLRDLESRGLLADTLVVWSTEFGRMPFTQGATGRDHNGGTSIGWLAGAGIRPGIAYGESDPWSWKAAHDKTTTYDVHATLLHLLGLDHERLTFRHNGADRRLTDVHGHVLRDILA